MRARARERARTRQTERESERGRAGPSTTSLIRRTARCAPCGGREEEKESRREGESARARARGNEAERQRERSRAAEREAGPLVDSNSRHPAGDWEDSELGWREEEGGRQSAGRQSGREAGGRAPVEPQSDVGYERSATRRRRPARVSPSSLR